MFPYIANKLHSGIYYWIQLCEATLIFSPDSVNRDRTPADYDILLPMGNVEEHVSAAWEIGGTLHGLVRAASCTDVGEEDIHSCGLAVQRLSASAKCECIFTERTVM